jgi:hypothetical protein
MIRLCRGASPGVSAWCTGDSIAIHANVGLARYAHEAGFLIRVPQGPSKTQE